MPAALFHLEVFEFKLEISLKVREEADRCSADSLHCYLGLLEPGEFPEQARPLVHPSEASSGQIPGPQVRRELLVE